MRPSSLAVIQRIMRQLPSFGCPIRRLALAAVVLALIPNCTSLDGTLTDAGAGRELTDPQEFPLTAEEQAFFEAQVECDAQYAAYDSTLQTISENTAAFPFVAVRVENDTDTSVQVWMYSYVTLPPYPTCDPYSGETPELFPDPDEHDLQELDARAPFVFAHGRADGRMKCGEFLAIVASAPATYDSILPVGRGFGFNYSGNVEFEGVGTRGNVAFEGDIAIGTWYLRPVIEDIDCEKDTVVIRVDLPLTLGVSDPDTGRLLTGPLPGHATVSVERAEVP